MNSKWILIFGLIASSNALAYSTCVTTDSRALHNTIYVTISSDTPEAATVSIGDGRSYNFYQVGRTPLYTLPQNASRSPGFSELSLTSTGLKIHQTQDTGAPLTISYTCH